MTHVLYAFSSQPWVDRLGWSLLHFLWQGSFIAALYAVVRTALKRPDSRYLLGCAALAAMMAAPVITWSLLAPSDAPPAPDYRLRNDPVPASTTAHPAAAPVGWNLSSTQAAAIQPWVVGFWLLGVTAFWLRLAGGWALAARVRVRRVRPAPDEWQQVLDRLAARIGVSRPVQLLVSAVVQVPTVVGWLRPVVLVPVGALSGVPAAQLEALLLHELAHIRRHDYLVNILQSVAEALLFYHPAVWWVSGHLRTERELCCDDVVVAATGDAFTYAQALAEWETCRPDRLAVAANGGSLAARIARLLGESRQPARVVRGPSVVVTAILLVAAAYAVFAQDTVRPAFQVASVKQNMKGGFGMGIRPQPGGRLTATNAPLLLIIQNAYSVQPFQVLGGPAWVNSERYDIEAKPEGEVDREQMWLMLQTLLAERFKLALHRDTKELPAYALVVNKGIFKPAPPKDGACAEMDPNSLPPPGGLTPCGKAVVWMSPHGVWMMGNKVQMAEVVRVLATILDRPVVDKTEFTGEFDLKLTFTPDESVSGLPGGGGPRALDAPRPVTDDSRPGIMAALQEQLGLKLTATKAPVEVLVIDHVERPTAN